MPATYVTRRLATEPDTYRLGWMAINHNARPVLAHNGDWDGFATLATVSFDGSHALFSATNCSDMNASGVSQVIQRMADGLFRLDATYREDRSLLSRIRHIGYL